MTNAINVRLGDGYVMVEPVVPPELEKALSYWHKEITFDQEKYKNVVKGSTKKLFITSQTIDKDDRLVQTMTTFPGFASKVLATLRDNGYDYKIIDTRTRLPEMDLEAAMKGLREYQYEGVYTCLKSGGGVLQCPTGFGKTHMMAGIIRGFKKESMVDRGTPLVVVVTPSKDIATKNYNDLREILPDREVGLIHATSKKYSEDIQVVTPESMGHVDVESAGLLIYDEVHTLTMPRMEQISRAEKAVRYGVSATPTGRFDGSDILIEAAFGPVVYAKSYADGIDVGALVPIRVYWIECPRPSGWPQDGYATKNGNYRNGLWRNKGMHQIVGDLMRKVPGDAQCLAIVDKTEHMDYLYPYLPEDTVMVHGGSNQKAMEKRKFTHVKAIKKKEREAIYAKVADAEVKRVLATGIYRVGVNFPELEVLINCEGMGSQIIAGQLPGRASRNIDGKNIAYMVDFWHPWDTVTDSHLKEKPGMLLRDDRSREKIYTSLGFEQVWVNDYHEIQFEDA